MPPQLTDQQTQMRQLLGDRMRRLRGARQMSQQRLAELIGRDRQTIGYYELGASSPTLDTLVAIADALEVPIEQLISRA